MKTRVWLKNIFPMILRYRKCDIRSRIGINKTKSITNLKVSEAETPTKIYSKNRTS